MGYWRNLNSLILEKGKNAEIGCSGEEMVHFSRCPIRLSQSREMSETLKNEQRNCPNTKNPSTSVRPSVEFQNQSCPCSEKIEFPNAVDGRNAGERFFVVENELANEMNDVVRQHNGGV